MNESPGDGASGEGADPRDEIPYSLTVTKHYPAQRLAEAEAIARGAIGCVNSGPVRADLEHDAPGTLKLRSVARSPSTPAIRYELDVRPGGWAADPALPAFDFDRLGWHDGGPPNVVDREIGWPKGGRPGLGPGHPRPDGDAPPQGNAPAIDLPSIVNAPRELRIDGSIYRARTLTLGQLGELLAWLEDRVAGGAAVVPLSSEAARLALASADGLAVILHLALSSCHPAITRDQARAMATSLGAEAEARLMAIAFRRRPGYAPPEDGAGQDLAESNWGATWEALTGHRADLYAAVGGLTLDQFDNFSARGELEGPDSLKPDDVQAMWEQAHAEQVTPGPAGPAGGDAP